MDVIHCPTCECSDPHSIALLSRRIASLTEELNMHMPLSPKAKSLLGGLSKSERFCCGFTGLKKSFWNDQVCGQFLAALGKSRVDMRFFCVQLLRPDMEDPDRVPCVPSAFEYRPGESFDITGTGLYWAEIPEVRAMHDDHFREWILDHLKPLWEAAGRAATEYPDE